MNDEILVSICCTTYNQEKYIRNTLDGFVYQICNFNFEIIVHDDCSLDGTSGILKEYNAKYPDLFKIIFQSENKYSQGIKITKEYIVPLIRGKYVAFCEGDDYWSDMHKLQKQVNVMEEHSECSLCIHKVRFMDEAGRLMKKNFTCPGAHISKEILSPEDFLAYEYEGYKSLGQLSSFLVRADYFIEYNQNSPMFANLKIMVGDLPLKLYLITKGKMYYMQDEMSRYRVDSKGSWTSKNLKVKSNFIEVQKHLIKMASLFNEYTNMKYQRYMDAYINNIEAQIEIKNARYKQVLSNEKFINWRRRQAKYYLTTLWIKEYLPIVHIMYKKIIKKK